MQRTLSSARHLLVLTSLGAAAAIVAACSSGSGTGIDDQETPRGGSAGAAGGKGGGSGKGGATSSKGGAGAGTSAGAAGSPSSKGGSAGSGAAGAAGALSGGAAGTDNVGTGGSATGKGGSASGGKSGTSAGGKAGSGTAGSSSGSSGASGSLAGGSNQGGTSAGGTSAGGTAAGGTAAGGTAGAGGTATGGSSAGGAGGIAAGGNAGAGGAPGPAACKVDGDCGAGTSGRCIEGTQGTKICAETCKDSCDDPLFRCALVVPQGQSAYEICVPKFAQSCRPCDFDSQCRFPDDTTDKSRCVPSGDAGSFCATDCTVTSCGLGQVCEDRLLGNGQTVKACVPQGGNLCECKPFWKGRGYKTTCGTKNGFGTCKGARTCDSGVLSDCDARQPALEVCDGVDSDCDGSVDDFANCDDDSSCTDDTCAPSASGGAKCQNTIKPNLCRIGTACVAAGDVNPANPCLVCDPARSQTAWSGAVGKSCSDGKSCTTGDQCDAAGACVGGAVQGDSFEVNDTVGAAKVIAAIDDVTKLFSKTLSATLPEGADQDWYKFGYTDATNFNKSTSPTVRLTAPSVVGVSYFLEVLYVCNSGTIEPNCAAGSTQVTVGGRVGCRSNQPTGTGNVEVKLNDFNCTGTTDESGTAFVHVYPAPGSAAVCEAYGLAWGDDD